MIAAPTRYERASDVDHALELLGEPDAKALAGGQSLIPVMKLRIARPSVVVDISRLELRGVEEKDGALHIGPLTTWAELAAAELPAGLEAIAECARGIGDLQVRNLGTIGGSIAHADPASDMPAVVIALGAQLRLRSHGGERVLPISEFFVGPFLDRARAAGARYRRPRPDSVAELRLRVRVGRAPGVGVRARGRCRARRPFRRDRRGDGGRCDAVRPGGRSARGDSRPPRSSATDSPSEEYRRELAVVVAERALASARKRAEENR